MMNKIETSALKISFPLRKHQKKSIQIKNDLESS